MTKPCCIAVLLGGPSAEREVSLRSGQAVAAALRSLGHAVHEVDPVGEWQLPAGTDVVFLALHGTYGEDGEVQRRLDDLGVPYTGCDEAASRIAFDKVDAKRRLLAAGLTTPEYFVVDAPSAPWPSDWAPPVVVKPVRQGSSVGLAFIEEIGEWSNALRTVLQHDVEALVEKRIEGREMTVGILDDEALPIVEVTPKQGRYDYHNKYTSGATEYSCPAALAEEVTRGVQEAGLRAFHAIGGRDYARVDVILDASGRVHVLEVNTLPGMTETSLLPKAAAARGWSFPALCQKMIDLARKRELAPSRR